MAAPFTSALAELVSNWLAAVRLGPVDTVLAVVHELPLVTGVGRGVLGVTHHQVGHRIHPAVLRVAACLLRLLALELLARGERGWIESAAPSVLPEVTLVLGEVEAIAPQALCVGRNGAPGWGAEAE